MERLNSDHELPEFVNNPIHRIVLRLDTGQFSAYYTNRLRERGELFLRDYGFMRTNQPQAGDIVGYRPTELPFSPVSFELNDWAYETYVLQGRSRIIHYGIIMDDGQVVSRSHRDDQLYIHPVLDPAVMGDREFTVLYFRNEESAPPRRRASKKK